jgi:hypothetical protein
LKSETRRTAIPDSKGIDSKTNPEQLQKSGIATPRLFKVIESS